METCTREFCWIVFSGTTFVRDWGSRTGQRENYNWNTGAFEDLAHPTGGSGAAMALRIFPKH